MEWRQFVMELRSLEPDRVEAVLTRNGARAVTLTDAADDPVLEPAPGETPLWASTRITGLFDADADFAALKKDLQDDLALPSLPPHRVEALEDREWEREWLRDFRPMRFGERLWIAPQEQPVDAAGAAVVRLDPGLAFGTGTHATTGLCLDWLAARDLRQQRILDYGCGSGILAVAALKLGAARVTAVDIDPQAILATRQNAVVNGVADKLETFEDAGRIHSAFDVVVANILAGTLIERADELACRVTSRGVIALSGILESQAADVIDAYRPRIKLDTAAVRDGWVLLTGARS